MMSTYTVRYGVYPSEGSTYKAIQGIVYYVKASSVLDAQRLFREYAAIAYCQAACVEVDSIVKYSYWL